MGGINIDSYCGNCVESEEYKKSNCFTEYSIRYFKKGEYISHKGNTVKNLMILFKGSVSVELVLDNGQSLITLHREAQYPIGAVGLFSFANNYRVDIIAKEDCSVYVISKSCVEEHLHRCVTFMRNFIAFNATKIDMIATHLAILSQKGIKAKLAFYIFTVVDGDDFSFGMKINELALYLRVERPSLSRALRQLVEENIILYKNGKGSIVNKRALQEIVEY